MSRNLSRKSEPILRPKTLWEVKPRVTKPPIMPGAPVFGGKKSHKGEAVLDCCKATTKQDTNTGRTFYSTN